MERNIEKLAPNRAQFLRLAAGLVSEAALIMQSERRAVAAQRGNFADDFAIDATAAMLFPEEAPLVPDTGKRDARAVWARVLAESAATSVLVYLHGNNNYVTVDKTGQSRVPDWAEGDAVARAGASAKRAAPLAYGLDKIDAKQIAKSPLLLVPEDAILRTGAFWASEPAGQYKDPARLRRLITDSASRLAVLKRPDGANFLRTATAPTERLYLCGHSGAGLPLHEAAASDIAFPSTGIPTDLWLFDCTYWSDTANFSQFCEAWHKAGRLSGQNAKHSRFVCVYRPKTQTEEIADLLRADIARRLGVNGEYLVTDHTQDNDESVVGPTLRKSGALFIRTWLPHDEIPTFFIPRLLETAA